MPRRSIALALALAAACGFDADYGGTMLRCPPGAPTCPAGFTCVAEVCTPTGASDGGVDASACALAALAPDNDTCATAIDLTAAALAPGGATAYGDTTGYAADLAPATLPGCTETVEPGPDAVYRLTLAAGDDVTIALAPSSHDAGFYLIDACSLTATCVGGADSPGAGGQEQRTLTVASAGTYYLVVDASTASAAGCYTLTVAIAR